MEMVFYLETLQISRYYKLMMKAIRKWIRLFFGFSRAESNGFILLIPLLVLVLFSEPIYRSLTHSQPDDFTTEKETLDSLAEILTERQAQKVMEPSAREMHLYTFDPNKAEIEELKTLGFSHQVATRMVHYREKGGTFKVKKDVLKMYGMDSSFYSMLAPYINLPESIVPDTKKKNFFAVADPKKIKASFELNQADTVQLKSIYGIGSVLALRITSFRERLGGFVSPGQLYEVYGLDSVTIEKLLARAYFNTDFEPNRININTCTEKELSAHPYISKSIAKAVVAYRFQHGDFANVEDIRQIKLIDAATYLKLSPYLTTQTKVNIREENTLE